MTTIATISVGDDLLAGMIDDGNSHWLSRRITSLGCIVGLHIVVGDKVEQVVAEVEQCVLQGFSVVIITGGRGLSSHTVTLEALSRFSGRSRAYDAGILENLRQWYLQLFRAHRTDYAELDLPRRELASIPLGSMILAGEPGVVPGVLLSLEKVDLISLPGDSRELQAIFLQWVEPYLLKSLVPPSIARREVRTTFHDPGLLEPVLARVHHEFPSVTSSIISPGSSGSNLITVILQAKGSSESEAAQMLDKAMALLYLGQERFV
jgi:molybdopterin-biosynthesis enzyme MoeA-like protein